MSNDPSFSSSSLIQPCFFAALTDSLQLHVAEFLAPQDLLCFHCTCQQMALLDTEALWHGWCRQRWEPWPRYRLNQARLRALDTNVIPNKSWKQRYVQVEREATRTTLRQDDLVNLDWYLCFVLSAGIRGETRSDPLPITFFESGQLQVPGYDLLPCRIHNQAPPRSPEHCIRHDLRGDRPFSRTQWIDINDFPSHFVARQASTAEWLICNEFVVMVSAPPRAEQEQGIYQDKEVWTLC